jgi:hypothetical protein
MAENAGGGSAAGVANEILQDALQSKDDRVRRVAEDIHKRMHATPAAAS